jgi:hypothetical protein
MFRLIYLGLLGWLVYGCFVNETVYMVTVSLLAVFNVFALAVLFWGFAAAWAIDAVFTGEVLDGKDFIDRALEENAGL